MFRDRDSSLMTVAKVFPSLYRIEIPLPESPLKSVNSYVIKAARPLVIDTGFNIDLCYKKFVEALREVGVDHKKADYFITHLHADHLGLAGRLAKEVYMSDIDSRIVEDFTSDIARWMEAIKFFTANGLPQRDGEEILKSHPGLRYLSKVSFHAVKDGDLFEHGGYSLKAILTPGHTPGHMCLYDEEKRILFSGDHILFDITPNISYWKGCESLRDYLKSLDEVYKLEVDTVFPGHRSFRGNVKKRIYEIKEHHKKRLREVVGALKGGVKNAWQIAPYINWDIKYRSWGEIPPVQKWFIINETLAHLQYLEKSGIVGRECRDGEIYYTLLETSSKLTTKLGE